ncbi:DgyrCDS1155 [Dimorphilus gyrociliatus]|uniref:DgyrCDS1155 n=1 Tax=Dimorphilus gyrociliatus TaxID=2664684 RepID=A0A7I8V888_9ANNE|nr:DgyrCDS1155 [Dimorphilus gyrociliatus]
MGSSAIPHLNNLPQWSRINTLDRARYPRTFMKDQKILQPISIVRRSSEDDDSEDKPLDDNVNPQQRIQHLERSIRFLQEQHRNVLTNLHEEIDELKRSNKELQFRIVIMQKEKSTSPITSPVNRTRQYKPATIEPESETSKLQPKPPPLPPPGQVDELKLIFLEQEIREVRKQLKEEKSKNIDLKQQFDDISREYAELKEEQEQKMISEVSEREVGYDLPLGASLNPLEIHDPSTGFPRQPTVEECEKIIRTLQITNEQQAHELNRLKTDLKDVLYSHKWTPDAFLLAKAYVVEDEAKERESHLPKIHSRRIPEMSYAQQKDSSVCLPALKQTMGNKAIERRKRTQVLQRARLRKEVSKQ